MSKLLVVISGHSFATFSVKHGNHHLSGPLASLSRKLQVSLTYIWGKLYLPIPRDEKVRITMLYSS